MTTYPQKPLWEGEERAKMHKWQFIKKIPGKFVRSKLLEVLIASSWTDMFGLQDRQSHGFPSAWIPGDTNSLWDVPGRCHSVISWVTRTSKERSFLFTLCTWRFWLVGQGRREYAMLALSFSTLPLQKFFLFPCGW